LHIKCSFFALLLYGIRNYKYYVVTDSMILYQNTIIIKMSSVFQAKKSKKVSNIRFHQYTNQCIENTNSI